MMDGRLHGKRVPLAAAAGAGFLSRAACLAPLALAFLSGSALAQGCALCKAAVASQTARFIQTMNLGILVLLVPPLAILASILIFTFRRDKERRST